MQPGSVPVAEGLFGDMDGTCALIGSRCTGCGTHFFPSRKHCCNPDCADSLLEAVALSRRGVLYSYTIQSYRPPGLFRMDPWAPYALGVVELPEGLRVMSMLACRNPQSLRIGMELEFRVGSIGHDADGRAVQTWQFQPTEDLAEQAK